MRMRQDDSFHHKIALQPKQTFVVIEKVPVNDIHVGFIQVQLIYVYNFLFTADRLKPMS